jgi:predicted esterase
LFIFSGALIGPKGMPRNYPGSFDEMPVFIGGSDVDPWVAYDFLSQTATVFEKMGADVDFRTYPGMGHTVNQDEIDRVRAMLLKAKQIAEVNVE